MPKLNWIALPIGITTTGRKGRDHHRLGHLDSLAQNVPAQIAEMDRVNGFVGTDLLATFVSPALRM